MSLIAALSIVRPQLPHPYLGTAPTHSALPHTHAFILADVESGWGVTIDPSNVSALQGLQCPINTYGVAGRVHGLRATPCKACPKNMRSPAGANGFSVCTNPAGFGYTSEGANQCPPDFWAAADSMQPCIPCPKGRYTDYEPGRGDLQDSVDDCKVPKGHGVYSQDAPVPWEPSLLSSFLDAKPCPVGWFSTGDTMLGVPSNNPVCRRCLPGSSTNEEGSENCNGRIPVGPANQLNLQCLHACQPTVFIYVVCSIQHMCCATTVDTNSPTPTPWATTFPERSRCLLLNPPPPTPSLYSTTPTPPPPTKPPHTR